MELATGQLAEEKIKTSPRLESTKRQRDREQEGCCCRVSKVKSKGDAGNILCDQVLGLFPIDN